MAESKTRGRPAIPGLTPHRYYGKRCKKHPELNGLRVTSCRECVGCHRAHTLRVANGIPSPTVRISRKEYERLLERIAELETRLYGATQEQEP